MMKCLHWKAFYSYFIFMLLNLFLVYLLRLLFRFIYWLFTTKIVFKKNKGNKCKSTTKNRILFVSDHCKTLKKKTGINSTIVIEKVSYTHRPRHTKTHSLTHTQLDVACLCTKWFRNIKPELIETETII